MFEIERETDKFSSYLCRAWEVLSGTPLRSPATVLGVLCRKWFPGIVELPSKAREPAYTWDRYALGEDDQYRNKQERILAEFWVSSSRTTLINPSH